MSLPRQRGVRSPLRERPGPQFLYYTMAGEKRTEERPPIFHLRTLPQSVKMNKFPVPADFRGKKHEHSVFFARYRLFFPNLLNLFFYSFKLFPHSYPPSFAFTTPLPFLRLGKCRKFFSFHPAEMTVDKPFRIMYNSRIVAVRPAGGRRFLQINGRGTAMALGSPGAGVFPAPDWYQVFIPSQGGNQPCLSSKDWPAPPWRR